MALKFISKHGKSAKDIRNLRQEIAILRTLNHENIILMFDAFETEREFCVVTEYAQVPCCVTCARWGEYLGEQQEELRGGTERRVGRVAREMVHGVSHEEILEILSRVRYFPRFVPLESVDLGLPTQYFIAGVVG